MLYDIAYPDMEVQICSYLCTLQIDSSRREWMKVHDWDILTIGMDSYFVMMSINNLIVVVAS